MVKIRIPASTANLGSGFDCLGIGLDLYNYISLEEADGCMIVSAGGEKIPEDETNLVYQSAKKIYEVCGKPFKGLSIFEESNIPLTRGLGSSSSCIAGGLFAANEILGRPLGKAELLDIAAEIEGHPDNVSPAILGGMTVSVIDGNKVRFVKSDLPKKLCFAAFIPDFELKTSEARAVLPKTLTLSDAVFNLSRSALMASSLAAGKYENLRVACEDAIHQPYRLPLIPGGKELISACLEKGALAAFVSGAGPTVLAIFDERESSVLKKTEEIFSSTGLSSWQIKILHADNEGVKAL